MYYLIGIYLIIILISLIKKKPNIIIYNAFYPLNSINEKTDLNELLKYTSIA